MNTRAEILSFIGIKLGQISAGNGFATDLGENVIYWQDLASEFGSPAVTYRDEFESHEEANRAYQNTLVITFEAIDYPAPAQKIAKSCDMLRDLIRLVLSDRTWGQRALDSRLVSNDKDFEVGGLTCCRVSLQVEIIYRTSVRQEG
jgi:hypothetical protein